MAAIENSVQISRPPEEVFEYLVDLRNELDWNPLAQSMEKLTDGPIGVGTRFRAKWKRSKVAEIEYRRYDHPRAWRAVSSGPLSIVFDGRVTASANGSRLAVRFEARPHGMMKPVFPLLLQIMRRSEKRNMEHIRRALEEPLAPHQL